MTIDPASAAMLGAMIGYAIRPDGRLEPIDYSKLAAILDGSDRAFVKKVSIDTSVARDTPQKFPYSGMAIFVENPSTPTLPVYIRFNSPDGEEFALTDFKKIRGPFGNFYITNEAGSGTLNLIITRGFQFELVEAVGTMSTTTDHGVLAGLGDDDHTQYFNSARHTKAAHDALGLEHGSLSGLTDDDHTQYFNSARHTKAVHDALGLEHGSLSGLTDDDHTQYFNSARHTKAAHDALGLEHGSLSGLTDDDHTQYFNSARHTKAAHDALGLEHGSLSGLTDDDHTQYQKESEKGAAGGYASLDAFGVVEQTPKTHGAAQHTDVTRELFIPASEGYILYGALAGRGFYAVAYAGADADLWVQVSFKVPDDFVSFTSVKAVWQSAAAAGDMYWWLHAHYAASGELYTTHSETPAMGTTTTDGVNLWNIQEPANALTLANLAKGDYIGITFSRDGDDANDTLDSGVYLLGLLFTYTAQQ